MHQIFVILQKKATEEGENSTEDPLYVMDSATQFMLDPFSDNLS